MLIAFVLFVKCLCIICAARKLQNVFLQHCVAMCCVTSEGSRYPHGLPCALHQERLGGSCWLRAQGFFQALLTLDFAFSEQKQYKNPNEERKAAKVSEVIEMSFGLEKLVG